MLFTRHFQVFPVGEHCEGNKLPLRYWRGVLPRLVFYFLLMFCVLLYFLQRLISCNTSFSNVLYPAIPSSPTFYILLYFLLQRLISCCTSFSNVSYPAILSSPLSYILLYFLFQRLISCYTFFSSVSCLLTFLFVSPAQVMEEEVNIIFLTKRMILKILFSRLCVSQSLQEVSDVSPNSSHAIQVCEALGHHIFENCTTYR